MDFYDFELPDWEIIVYEDAQLPEETRHFQNEVPSGEVNLDGNKANTQCQISRSKNDGGTTVGQSVQISVTESELDAAKLSKKRKNEIDRAYRERQKEIRQKEKEELQFLRQQNADLKLSLEAAKQEADKSKLAYQQNDAEECKIVFESNLPNDEAKARLMDIISKLPDGSTVLLENRCKRMIVKGTDIDFNGLWQELQRVCAPRLVFFSQSGETAGK